MKPLAVISIALVLCSCFTPEAADLNFKLYTSRFVALCSMENFTWEDTGEFAPDAQYRNLIVGRPKGGENWHVTQCAGRDPEPLRCYMKIGLVEAPGLMCETENGEVESYRRLTGLI